ncbi:hypothetical protein R0135_14105 [Congregibacter variabilis]|uniref:SMODS-associating 2TM beta-strand rich effector domain-containing protein n=1 Tax=Congregibacter variabilis TaxID=3081200 RepID=A0ABZ0I477_9GAMM|nr:hypothetical protein R0135_14105 [Congregibacter sp. IMCC43200]
MGYSIPFNLILIPLISGFWFVHKWKRTSIDSARSDRTRLIFFASIAGLVFAVVSRFFVVVLDQLEAFIVVTKWWGEFALFDHSGAAFLTLPLSYLSAICANWMDARSPYEVLVDWIKEHGNGLENFFIEASERANQDGTMVMISLDDNKVYVGWVQQGMREPHEPETFFSVVPALSGYRSPVTKELKFTDNYSDVIAKLGDGKSNLNDADFKKVIPVDRIASIGFFDPENYYLFEKLR